jgi:hypothetical protein
MSGINFVSNTINNQRSIINRRLAANRLAAAIINSPPVVKRVFVIKKMEEVVKNKPLPVFVTNQISEYVPVSVPDNVPVVFLKKMN